MKKLILFLFGLVALQNAQGQDLSMDYYSYLYNWYNINPAYTSKDDKMAAILNIRQRSGVNFNNSMIGIKGMSGENQGIGGRIISDTRGAFQVLKIDATYGYKIVLNSNSALHLGLSAGIVNKTFNVSRIKNYESLDQTDPVLQNSNLKESFFSAGTGIVYDYKNFELSASAPNLIESGQQMSKNLLLMSNYKFFATPDIHLTPMLFYFQMPVVKSYGGVQLKTDYKNLIWLQGGYQTNQSLNIGAGFIFNVLSFGYNYSSASYVINNQSGGTHEVFIKIKITTQGQNQETKPITEPEIKPAKAE